MKTTPNFKVERTAEGVPRVFLLCSDCDAVIREIFPKQTVSVLRAYYCDKCDDGTIKINPKVKNER